MKFLKISNGTSWMQGYAIMVLLPALEWLMPNEPWWQSMLDKWHQLYSLDMDQPINTTQSKY